MTDLFSDYDFNNLFILDLANNHQGSVKHGLNIIRTFSKIAKNNNIKAVFKFQFRDLPDFIHKDEFKSSQNKHVSRFLSTKLNWNEFQILRDEVKNQGMLAACTPFDEKSVEMIQSMRFEIIKVASCSAKDFPLLEKIAESGLPVIASTGGLNIDEVDNLVSFFEHKAVEFALMHCVSIYPTPDEACNLSCISDFKSRYPDITIGWSTHEPPSDLIQIGIAYSLGARMFERHIGIPTEKITLNKYSSTPEEIENWLKAWKRVSIITGLPLRKNLLKEETESIDLLRRGVFVKNSIKESEILKKENVYFAFPYREGQLSSGAWREGIIANKNFKKDSPIFISEISIPKDNEQKVIKTAIHKVKALLAYAKVPLNHEFKTEYSHHYGISNFNEIGAVLITVVNREYAKKILVQLPGQLHPWHFHKLKEETFIVIYGNLNIEISKKKLTLSPGDQITVPPGIWHRFWTNNGCVFEEISTTAYKNDSVYRDPEINKLEYFQRKTKVDHWGRFQLKNKSIKKELSFNNQE